MKKRWLIPLSLFVLLLVFAVIYLGPRLPIISGYAAKNLCSCVFVAGRDTEWAVGEDLNFSLVKYASSSVDMGDQSVTSSVLGFGTQKAIFREGLGCALLADLPESEVRASQFKAPPTSAKIADTIYWPMGDLLPDTLPAGVNKAQVEAFIESAFDDPGQAEKVLKTRALVVVYKGQLIAEKYAEGFDKHTRQLGWSMAKSVTSTLIGRLVEQGKVRIDAPPNFTEWQSDERQQIKVSNLIQMNSGLEWFENYGTVSDATRMLYARGDMFTYAKSLPLESPPSTVWEYSSGSSNLLAGYIRGFFDDEQAYWAFPYEELFHKIGMHSALFEPDAADIFVSSSYLWASPRDWARYGQLYLQDGIWQGERLLPSGWVDYTRMVAPGSQGKYGAAFWLNRASTFPDLPPDTYWCDGFQGQYVMIIPSEDLVVVRLGYAEKLDINRFVSLLIQVLKGEKLNIQ